MKTILTGTLLFFSIFNSSLAYQMMTCKEVMDDNITDYAEYNSNLDKLLLIATHGERTADRYDNTWINAICNNNKDSQENIEYMVNYGYIKKSEIVRAQEALGLEKRSNEGIRHEQARNFLSTIGLCSACVSNPSYTYAKAPLSKCAKQIDKAMSGDISAIKELQNTPEYCE